MFKRTIGVAANGDESMMDDKCENKGNVLIENINEENERLRRDNEILRRELACMSPTKRVPLQERRSDAAYGKARGGAGSPRPIRSKVNTVGVRGIFAVSWRICGSAMMLCRGHRAGVGVGTRARRR